MPKDLVVRPATRDDIAAITRIYADAVLFGTASFEIEAPDESEMLARFEKLTSAGFPYLVAVLQGGIAGYCYAGAYRPRPAYRWSVENSVYIAPDMQGKGVGGKLLDQLIEACESLGFRQMLAVIGGGDHQPSIRLHRAAGFVKVGQIIGVGRKFDQWHDSVIMQRRLGKGSETDPGQGETS